MNIEPTGDNSADLRLISDVTNCFLIITTLVWPDLWSAKQPYIANFHNWLQLNNRKHLAVDSTDLRQDSRVVHPFHGTGQEFDMTEYEVLRFDQWDSKDLLSETTSPSESGSTPITPITPPQTPQSSPSSTPSPPPTPPAPEQAEDGGKGEKAASGSPQLRLIKRKAPEVRHLINVAAQLLPDSNCLLRVVMYSSIH